MDLTNDDLIIDKIINNKILIVEDSKSINKIISKRFVEKGFECESVYTLKESRELLEKGSFGYILLDINLPDGTGYDLVPELLGRKEKIFILTSSTNKELQNDSFKKGVVDFIIKDRNLFQKMNQIIQTIQQLEKNRLKNILIIDDSIVIREQLKDLLKNRNYNIELAADSFTALDILSSKKIDLILLDLHLKDCYGLDFLQRIKPEYIDVQKIPVMIIAGNVENQTIRDGLKCGAVDVLKKPYIIEEVVLKVDLWIEFNRREHEILEKQKLFEQYKNTVDRSSIVSKTDKKGLITYVNQEFCDISGYTKEELLGKPHNIIRHPDEKKELFELLWYTITVLKEPWQGEIRNRKKDGSSYWVKAIINPILDVDGEVIEYIGIRTDITQQEKIKQYFENQMNISNKNFNSALNLTKEYKEAINKSTILSRTNLDGKITYVNDKFMELSGYSESELIGNNHNILKHPDTPKEIHTQIWKCIKNGKAWQGVLKNRDKHRNSYWVDTTILPIKDEKGEIIEFMAIRNNLTQIFELHSEIEATQREVVYKMGEIGETRSKETGNHVKRVAEYSKLLAKLYGLSENECEILFTASPMHDIGKVGIPDEVLKKPGRLTDEEFKIMQSHAQIGYNILKGSTRDVLKAAAIVAYEHHERWDGKGYPQGLAGEDIHIYGRITAIADVFDALGSDRCYKKAWEDEKILRVFEEEIGKQFDPNLMRLFLDNIEDFKEIRNRYRDE